MAGDQAGFSPTTEHLMAPTSSVGAISSRRACAVASVRWSARGLLAVSALAAFCLVHMATAKKVLGTKIRGGGHGGNQVYRVDPSTDLEMCKAVIREMHTEVLKHSLTADGEDDIYETAGMAICLGVVQNYTFEEVPGKKRWKFVRKARGDNDDDDEDARLLAAFGGANEANGDDTASKKAVEGLLLAKKACMDFTEAMQMEISEVVYARVHTHDGNTIAEEFCPRAIKPAKERVQAYKEATPLKERAKNDPHAMMSEMLKTRDTSGAISEMLEMEASFPERMLDEPQQRIILHATDQLVCQVCKVAVRQAHKRMPGVEAMPAFKDKWQRQALVSEAVNTICHGKDKAKLEAGYYPAVPGNPPEWANDYFIVKRTSDYALKKSEPAVADMVRVTQVEGESAEAGDASELDNENWAKSREKHEYDVMRGAVIRAACKRAVDERLDTEEGDLADLFLQERGQDAKALAQLYCKPVCAEVHATKTGAAEEL